MNNVMNCKGVLKLPGKICLSAELNQYWGTVSEKTVYTFQQVLLAVWFGQ